MKKWPVLFSITTTDSESQSTDKKERVTSTLSFRVSGWRSTGSVAFEPTMR